jgi:hypothetical protein
MKKLSLFIFIFLGTALFAQNMVSNPGFENWSSGEPDDWTYESGVTFTEETTIVHGGSSSAMVYLITQTQGDTDTQNTEFAVTPGTPYTASVWAYDNDPAGRIMLVLYWVGANTTWTNQYSSDQDSWQQLTYSGSVPDGATGLQVGFRFYDVSANWDGDATLYIDDVSYVSSTSVSIISAYSVNNTEMDVYYNGNVSSVSAGDYSLTGSANITFSSAAIDISDATLVHLTGASANMVGDAVLDNIADSENASDYDFYAGIMPVAYTNTVYSGRTTIQNGYNATFQARVSANDAYNNVWIHDAAGAYNGVLVFDYNFDALVSVGDEILLVAQRTEYSDLTELEDPLLLSAVAGTHYSATIIAGSEIDATIAANTNPAEKWEGQLVQIENAQVESYDSDNYLYTCTDDGGSTYFKMGDNVNYHFGSITVTVGESYNITGVVDFYDGEYRINPRTQADLEESGSGQLPPPENVVILRDGGDITITWDDVTGASSYNIYSDSDPYGSFSTLEDNIPATLTEWSETIPADEKKFYLIKAE